MDPVTFLVELFESALKLPQEIATVALRDPLSVILVLVGSLMLALSLGVFGYVTLGAVVDLLTPSFDREPRREAR